MTALKRWLPLTVALAILIVAALAFRNRPTTVQVIEVRQETLAEVLALSGRVHGVEESELAPEVGGTLQAFFVEEGQSVKAGDRLAELDLSRLKSELQKAEQAVKVAQAQLAVASREPLPSEIAEVRGEVEGQQRAAAANLEKARQVLLELERGPRPEQIEQARAVVREATAELEQRQREAQRQQNLVSQGAVSRQTAEQAQTLAETALENRRNAEARLAELENGARPEELAQARQEVAAAKALQVEAERAGSARLQQILEQPRSEDVELARAQVLEAQSAAAVVKKQLEQAVLKAPYDGVVGRRLLRVGDQAGPSSPILTFSSRPALEIRVDVDESDRARVRLGQSAVIRANGFDQTFQAKVAETAPEVDSIRGTMETRLRADSPPEWLLPGQTVDVNLILDEQKPRLVIPLTCVIRRGDKAEVAVIENDTVRLRDVEISSPLEQGYLVHAGLTEKEVVALTPQGLSEGQKVRPQAVK